MGALNIKDACINFDFGFEPIPINGDFELLLVESDTFVVINYEQCEVKLKIHSRVNYMNDPYGLE